MRTFILILLFAYSLPLARAEGLLGNALPTQESSQSVLAQSAVGNLTDDAVMAYLEALAFCLDQVGSPVEFTQEDVQVFKDGMAQAFPLLPPDTQLGLVNARATWTLYQQQWNLLSYDDKVAFAYDVLALAYGEQAAAEALGLNTSTASGSNSGGGEYYGIDSGASVCYSGTCEDTGYGSTINYGADGSISEY